MGTGRKTKREVLKSIIKKDYYEKKQKKSLKEMREVSLRKLTTVGVHHNTSLGTSTRALMYSVLARVNI